MRLNKAEKMIGERCYENAKNKGAAGRFLNRYERMIRDKAIAKQKEEVREKEWN